MALSSDDLENSTTQIGQTAPTAKLRRIAILFNKSINEEDGNFDVTDDYPRRTATDYEDDVEADRRKPAQVVQATYAFEPEDIAAVKEAFGPRWLGDEVPFLTLSKGYSKKRATRMQQAPPRPDTRRGLLMDTKCCGRPSC